MSDIRPGPRQRSSLIPEDQLPCQLESTGAPAGRAAWCLLLALCAAFGAGCRASGEIVYKDAPVRVEQIGYRGWEGAYRLSNGQAELIFVPQVARIIHFGVVDGPNLLWVNDRTAPDRPDACEPLPTLGGWVNYGGHKLWPAPQKLWHWPPPAALDNGECRVQVTPAGSLRVMGRPSEELGIRFDRLITMAPRARRVRIQQTMVNVSEGPVTWAVWDVTQVPAGGTVYVPLGPGADYRTGDGEPLGPNWRREEAMLELVAPPQEGPGRKVFVSGPPGWLGHRSGDWLFVKRFALGEAPRRTRRRLGRCGPGRAATWNWK